MTEFKRDQVVSHRQIWKRDDGYVIEQLDYPTPNIFAVRFRMRCIGMFSHFEQAMRYADFAAQKNSEQSPEWQWTGDGVRRPQ